MDTYWLECKDGGIARAAELDLPSFFEDVRPVFMRRLREEGKEKKKKKNYDTLIQRIIRKKLSVVRLINHD